MSQWGGIGASQDWAESQLGISQPSAGPPRIYSEYLTGIGMQEEAATVRFSAQEQRLIDQFNQDMEWVKEQAMMDYEQAIKVAQIYGGAQTGAAGIYAAGGVQEAEIGAGATVESANIRAQAAIEVANIAAEAQKYGDDIKLQIAQGYQAVEREKIELERQRIGAIEFAQPGNWISRFGFMRGQTPEQTTALEAVPGGQTVFDAEIPSFTDMRGGQAVVGEGPELATMTPGGVEFTPVTPEDQKQLATLGVPSFQEGGTLRAGNALLPFPTRMGNAPSQGGSSYSGGASGLQRGPVVRGDAGPPGGYNLLQRRMKQQRLDEARRRQGIETAGMQARRTGQGLYESRPAFERRQAAATSGGAGDDGGDAAETGGATLPAPSPLPEPGPLNELPFLQFARAGGQTNVPGFAAWTGQNTAPSMGITDPVPPPWQYNLQQFLNFTPQEQQGMAAMWRKFMMIPGETPQEMVSNAINMMSRSAWRGAAIPMTRYGG